MKPRSMRVALGVFLLLCGFAGGYVVGHRTTFAWTNRWLAAETQFNLAQRVETLAKLRTGDAAGAISGLEQTMDTAAVNLAQRRPWGEIETDVRSTLQLVKAYRSRYPARSKGELTALLDTVPMPEAEYCSPALRELLRSTPR